MERRPSPARDRQHRHDFHRFAREDREMGMVLEQFGRGLLRVRFHHHEGAEIVAGVLDAAGRDPLGLAQWPAHADHRGLMFFHPGFPGRHALALLRLALVFGKGHPGLHFGAGFAPQKNRQEIVAHASSSLWGQVFLIKSFSVSSSTAPGCTTPLMMKVGVPSTPSLWARSLLAARVLAISGSFMSASSLAMSMPTLAATASMVG